MDTKQPLRKVAEAINQKRRMEVFNLIETNHPIHDYLKDLRNSGVFNKGNKSKSMRMIAHVPGVVDRFFQKLYGKDYWKEPGFFEKHYPEWLVIDPKHLRGGN